MKQAKQEKNNPLNMRGLSLFNSLFKDLLSVMIDIHRDLCGVRFDEVKDIFKRRDGIDNKQAFGVIKKRVLVHF